VPLTEVDDNDSIQLFVVDDPSGHSASPTISRSTSIRKTSTSCELELMPWDEVRIDLSQRWVWNGTLVISNAWIDASIREHISIPGRATDGDGYGYQWFTTDLIRSPTTIGCRRSRGDMKNQQTRRLL